MDSAGELDRDSSVKHFDFQDVSLTPSAFRSLGAAAAASAEDCSMDGPGDVPSPLDDLREDARRIHENLASSGTFLYDFAHEFVQREAEEAGKEDCSAKQNQSAVAMLGDEYLELLVKEGILRRLAGWKIGDDNSQDGSAFMKENDPEDVGDQLTELRNANAETISEIESLIRAIADDVNGFEDDLRTEYRCVDAFDQELDKLETEQGIVACLDVDANGHSNVVSKQSENLQELESTIRRLEETLRQNELDYSQAEAASESRIQQYNREIEELQAQATQLDKEEQRMKILIDVTTGFLQTQRQLECSNDLSVTKVEGGYDLHLKTHVHDGYGQNTTERPSKTWEHNLHVKIDDKIPHVEEARLVPEDVPITDIVAQAQERSISTEAFKQAQDNELAKLGPQVAYIVRKVQERLVIHSCKLASLSSAASDPRYRVEHMPGNSSLRVITPGQLKALVDIPDNWPMPGCPLRLQSLESLSADAPTYDSLQHVTEVANKLPESLRQDLLTFVKAVEEIGTK